MLAVEKSGLKFADVYPDFAGITIADQTNPRTVTPAEQVANDIVNGKNTSKPLLYVGVACVVLLVFKWLQ